jgi:hypothetical protein
VNERKAAAPALLLTKELQLLEGLPGFEPQLTDPHQLVGATKETVIQAGVGVGLDRYEQERAKL